MRDSEAVKFSAAIAIPLEAVSNLFWNAPKSARCFVTVFKALSIVAIVMFAFSGVVREMIESASPLRPARPRAVAVIVPTNTETF